MKAAADHDITVGGPELAAAAVKAGLVDESTCSSLPLSWAGGSAPSPAESR